ncbi:glycoside hydrolase family 28 protein [Collinsella tanakaei]|uniref:glycoside hydrolase family 28 protein n=1 Tax=Collinsella tanakaei TaxID=626935 RepID=UPI00195DC552|nr:glycoside hydrolase family 28 protein [Collinsella tanakaei]MBM6754933.1 glycoside hydrolase family 28 protein [Collinsella tanakaei]
MQLSVSWKCARAAVVELHDGESLFTCADPWNIFINDEPAGTTDRVVTYLDGLEPRSVYRVRFERGDDVATTVVVTEDESFTLDVREFGAAGDGERDDTVSIQAAIMSCPERGRVLIPAGTYKITSVFLKSGISVELAEGAVLKARFDRENLAYLPADATGAPGAGYAGSGRLPLGTWEGETCRMFCGALMGMHVTDCVVYGRGVIDGQASFDEDNWWFEAKKIRIAARPRLIFLSECSNMSFAGITVRNSPSWNIHPVLSSHLGFWCLTIEGPKVSPNTDGLNPESCCSVTIKGCHFSVGDDCIAVKSGKLSMPRALRPPCRDILIEQCYMHDGHGSIVLGSEISGGVCGLTARNCRFERTDRGLRVKTRRGRGKDSVIDGVCFENIKMDQVLTPFVVNSFYFCDVDGKTDYVQTREPLPVDERTPKVASLVFKDIEAHGCHAAAAWISGLPESPIDTLELHNVHVTFADDAKPAVPAMACGVDEMCRAGFTAEHVDELVLDRVNIEGTEGDPYVLTDVKEVVRR